MTKVINRSIKLVGDKINSTLRVFAYDNDGNVLMCAGTTAPTGAGYAKGCIFLKTDAADGTKGFYENQGTTTTASFDLTGSIATADIAANAVTLAKLATGITASHIVKFFKLGSTITTTTLTGLAVDDIVVSIIGDGTVTVALCSVADTLPADPADTTYVVVFRAVA